MVASREAAEQFRDSSDEAGTLYFGALLQEGPQRR